MSQQVHEDSPPEQLHRGTSAILLEHARTPQFEQFLALTTPEHVSDVVLSGGIEAIWRLLRRFPACQAIGADDPVAVCPVNHEHVAAVWIILVEVTRLRLHFRRRLGVHLDVENLVPQALGGLDLRRCRCQARLKRAGRVEQGVFIVGNVTQRRVLRRHHCFSFVTASC